MAFKMSHNSLFAILLRSEWWYSVLIGLAAIAISLAVFGGKYLLLGIFGALPFFCVAGFVGFKQAKLPSQKRIQEVQAEARSMSTKQIANKIAQAYIDIRFDAEKFNGDAADLALIRGNRTILLCTKRYKVGNTGVDPLKQLIAAGEKTEATGYLYVALGDISAAAIEFAKKNDIELIQAARLAAFFDGKANVE